ncbi:MAG: signal peptidase I [Lachnospiraceae bacterium]|nr:signal peptidase I [Lachnospiraceae bacterium]
MEERKRYIPLGSRIFHAIQWIYVGLLILCFAAGLFSLAVNAISAKIGTGIRFLAVRADSMQPEFCEGDLAVVRTQRAEKISEGDVIAYRPGEEADAYLIHRVTEKISDYEGAGVTCFYTAGDFNAEEDGILVDESHVIGMVVLTIPKLGYVLRFLVMRWYCPVLVVLAAFLIFLAIRLARYWMDHREDDFPDGEEIATGGFWLKNRNGKGIRIAKWQVAHVLSPVLFLAAVAGVLVLWKVSEVEIIDTLTQAESGGVVVVEDFANGSELEGVRVMNTGNLESLIRAVLTGDGWSFDYEHVVTRAAGDAETESYITAVSDGCILRIYLASVVLSTDKENQDIESRYPSEEDYDMESEEGAEAYEEASQAADTSLKYNWTFDVGNSDGKTVYLYYNYSLQPATGTKELIERVELVTNGAEGTGGMTNAADDSLLCRMENIPVMRNEDMSDTERLQAAQEGYGWNLEVKSAYGVMEGIQISSKMFYRKTIMLEWQTPEEKEKQLEEESGYGSMD